MILIGGKSYLAEQKNWNCLFKNLKEISEKTGNELRNGKENDDNE